MWTQFWDMNSGGGTKEPYDRIYIEAPMEEAKVIFYNRFGHSPERVSCTCCGEDYSISEDADLAQLTGYHRNCAWDQQQHKYVEQPNLKYGRTTLIALDDYIVQGDVLVIFDIDIKPEEREGDVPDQGYVWMG